MYVCLCYGLSEKRIREIVSAGASSMADVQRKCAAGTNCGACVRHLKAVVCGQLGATKGATTESKDG